MRGRDAATGAPNEHFAVTWDCRQGTIAASGGRAAGTGLSVFFCGYLGDSRAHDDIARAYLRHGHRFPNELAGQYAGVVVDETRRRVVAFQDSFGLRTLYYARAGGRWTFSSAIEDVLAAGESRLIDEDFAAAYLTTGGSLSGATPYKGVRQLALGRVLVVEKAGARLGQIYRPPRAGPVLSATEQQERLVVLLDQAIGRAMEPGRRHLCLFSGGLDSTTVLAFAKRRPFALAALTIASPSGANGDDELYAAPAARAMEIDHLVIDKDRYPPLSMPAQPAQALPGPQLNHALQREQQRIIRDGGYTVLLTGNGGDQLFGAWDGRPYGLGDGIGAFKWRQLIADCRALAADTPGGFHWSHFAIGYAIPAWIRTLSGRRIASAAESRSLADWISPGLISRTGLRRRASRSPVPHWGRPSVQHLWEEVHLLAHLASNAANRFAQCSTRHPLFDRPLIEHMLSIDAGRDTRYRRDRALQRAALTNVIPEAVRNRRSKGGGTGHQERALLDNPALVAVLTEKPAIARLGLVDEERWRIAVNRARFGVVSHLGSFQAALTLELWLRNLDAGLEMRR